MSDRVAKRFVAEYTEALDRLENLMIFGTTHPERALPADYLGAHNRREREAVATKACPFGRPACDKLLGED